MKNFKKNTAKFIAVASLITLTIPALAEWRRVGPYGGNDLYPTAGGCTLGGWTCQQVRIKSVPDPKAVDTSSTQRKAANSSTDAGSVAGTEAVYCQNSEGHIKSASKGCATGWKKVWINS